MHHLFNAGLVVSIATTSSLVVLITIFLFYFSFPLFENFFDFFILKWDESANLYGLIPMILGTLYITILATIFATIMSLSFGSIMAFFMPKKYSDLINRFIHFLSGVPTVLYAFVAIFLLVPIVNEFLDGSGFSIITASIVLSFVLLPTMTIIIYNTFISTSKDAIFAATALGATKEDLFFSLVLKESKNGILTAIILGFARAVGDTMIALMIAGNTLKIPGSILDSTRTLTAHIALINANDYESIAFKAIFLSGLILILISFSTVLAIKFINRSN